MPKLKENQVPSYRLHKQSGQAIVTLSGRDHLLGDHGTPASKEKYDRLIAEWLANGRRASYRNVEGITVSRVLAEFWAHAKTYYVDGDGQPAKELENFRLALIPLRQLYGATLVADFGPLALHALQRDMVGRGWSRKYINRQIGRIRQVFKWAASQELAPALLCHALATVPGLKRGKTEAGDYDAVGPVDEEHVQAVLPHVSRQVSAMIRLQLLTGMRPGEVCTMRATDIDAASGKVWIYVPKQHKTAHHDIKREIRIGPKGQEIVREFWKADLSGCLFSPIDAERERRAELAQRRKTPLSCGNVPGSNVKRAPERAPRAHYTSTSYRHPTKVLSASR